MAFAAGPVWRGGSLLGRGKTRRGEAFLAKGQIKSHGAKQGESGAHLFRKGTPRRSLKTSHITALTKEIAIHLSEPISQQRLNAQLINKFQVALQETR